FFFLVIGILISFFGILPFVFDYPFGEGANSGPSNYWDLILMISYEGKGKYLIVGALLLVLTIPAIIKQKK
ncbi:hypothetical protein V7147_06740, partial [Bacillus sp. JJ1521]|uniref:hypothetical protein n=1 Tax=Bacillus sp. JJ1521 TaxID=3122957 RepID=UPI002FFDA967